MSRHNTRSKNKRNRTDSTQDSSSFQVLRKIHVTGEVSRSDISQLYSITKPACEGCRGNSKDNPNCFCGLIPSSNGTRKSGLWQKMSDIIASLGPNPCRDLRSSPDTPAGLTNLGATCYANSILQCLYMNTAFRVGIFAVEMELLRQHPVLDQLTRLFAQLHSSKMAFIDSAPFIRTLELDNGVQQDSHEFLTLFLSLLERSLRHSKAPRSRNVVQDLFRGTVSNVTRCSVCGRESKASSKVEDFYEIELNIKGLNNISESLEDYLSVEELEGENQYFCESCGMRVNATRFIKLRELPVIVNFQLKRYVFLPKTTTKKKITSLFSFPKELNMSRHISSPNELAFTYELSAILIHKGTAVNSGHYVAHIKDDNTGQWWEFDDEHVSKLGRYPFGLGPSNSSTKSSPLQIDHHEQPQAVSNGNHTSSAGISALTSSKPAKLEEIFSSSDAYMLMYSRKAVKENIDKAQGGSAMNTNNIDGSLPLHFSDLVDSLNASYAKACEEFQLKKDSQISNITERRQEVKSILAEAPVRSNEEPYFWVSTEWLRQWADSIIPRCIENDAVQCMHGKLPVSKVHSVKRVSVGSWEKLFSKYGGGPVLSMEDSCIECIRSEATHAISADNYRDRRASLKEAAEDALAGTCSEENLYYVSRTWLISWLRRKSTDAPSEADAGPTAALRCPHGDLVPEHAAGAKRVLIPASLWRFIYENAIFVKPDDPVGCSVFSSDSDPCAICNVELTELSCLEITLREAKIKQRQNHEKLSLGKSIILYPGTKYFLIPSSWLAKWRTYIMATGKNISSSVEPDNLEILLESLVCMKHSRLIERPPELICKRGVITQNSSADVGLTLISENDWHLFCEEWNVTESKGISAQVLLSSIFSDNLVNSDQEKPISELDVELSNNDTEEATETKKPFIKTFPELCETCIGERESCELMRKLNYHDEDICVVLVSGKEPPQLLLEASGCMPKFDRRTSKRSRKGLSGNTATLRVSCSTSIYQLKMMIWESFGVVKENQKLHKGSVEIEDDLATLADKNIFPGDVLWFSNSGIHESRDIADELSDHKRGSNQAEEGFRGTLLSLDVPTQESQDART